MSSGSEDRPPDQIRQDPFNPDQPQTGQHQPSQYPPGPAGYPPQFYAPVMVRNNPFAITALVCGIIQFPLGLCVFGNTSSS